MAAKNSSFPIQFHSDATQFEIIRDALRENEVLLLVGGLGVGKSRMSHDATHDLGYDFIDARLSQYDPVDVRGLPFQRRNKDEVAWAKPDWFQAVLKSLDTGRIPVIGWDEMNTASIGTMNTALQAILDRRVGPHIFPKEVRQIAMVNRKTHRAHVNPMSAPLINRFTVVNVEVVKSQWNQWAFANGIHEAVLAYINFRPEALYQEPAKVKDEFMNFPTPRGWERVSRLIGKRLFDTRYLTGAIGEGASVEFQTYLEERANMPDTDRLIAGKEDYDFATAKISISYAVTVALAQRARSDLELIEPCGKILHHIRPEIAALYFALLLQSNLAGVVRKLTEAHSIRGWMQKHQSLIQKAMR